MSTQIKDFTNLHKKIQNDGITHINVYSKGQTELGRFLSNFTHVPIETEDGKFNSIEGYWYWLSCKNDQLREVSGYEAKHLGRILGGQYWQSSEEFQRKICSAIKNKLQTSIAEELLIKNKNILHLPLDHYYVYNNRIHRPKEGKWVITYIESWIKTNYAINKNI